MEKIRNYVSNEYGLDFDDFILVEIGNKIEVYLILASGNEYFLCYINKESI